MSEKNLWSRLRKNNSVHYHRNLWIILPMLNEHSSLFLSPGHAEFPSKKSFLFLLYASIHFLALFLSLLESNKKGFVSFSLCNYDRTNYLHAETTDAGFYRSAHLFLRREQFEKPFEIELSKEHISVDP